MAARKGTRPPAAGRGRRKGVPNKMTRALKDMILGALDELGGEAWLVEQARANPALFMNLLARVLPHTLAAEDSPVPFVFQVSKTDMML